MNRTTQEVTFVCDFQPLAIPDLEYTVQWFLNDKELKKETLNNSTQSSLHEALLSQLFYKDKVQAPPGFQKDWFWLDAHECIEMLINALKLNPCGTLLDFFFCKPPTERVLLDFATEFDCSNQSPVLLCIWDIFLANQ